ncbi:MAG: aromatic ring-hydroxylating dioxygenase subunit alpha [Steroidobacteraceae bacterium]|jgi:Rieske 2Fe-2S family protein
MNARLSPNTPSVLTAREDMLARLRRRKPATALERDFYTKPEDFQIDLDMIWYRDWLFVGHDCEVLNPGQYLTVQVGEYPVVVVRDRDGGLRAFHNSCRHRGSRICSDEHGTSARLMCPYHQWTYSLDGRLLAARDMGSSFDKTQYGLKSIHCTSVGGYIWICLAKAAPDFDPVRRQLEPYFLPHNLHQAKVAYEYTIIENANWKLVWENNRECYHCFANHPELLRTFPEDPTISGVDDATSNPRIATKWNHWESIGLPSQFKISADGQYRTTRYPLIEGKTSYTMDGQAAVKRPLSDAVIEPDIGTLLLFHFPTTWNHVMADHATTFRLLPLSPTTTQLTTKWLVNRDAVEGVDYDLKRLTEVWVATNDSDRRVCQENQIGVNSPAYVPGPYSPVHEAGVTQFVDWYCTHIEERLTGSLKMPSSIA